MKTIAYVERTRAEYPAQWRAITDTGEVVFIIQGAEITVIDGDNKEIFKGKSPKTFGIDMYTLQEETASALKWREKYPSLPPQEKPECSHCRGTEKVIEVHFRTPGRVNRYYSEPSRLCEPCRQGTYKTRFKKI